MSDSKIIYYYHTDTFENQSYLMMVTNNGKSDGQPIGRKPSDSRLFGIII